MSDPHLPVPVPGAQGASGGTEAHIEYVVESRHHGDVERWLVVRPCDEAAAGLEALGLAASAACRVVVEEASLRPVGILTDEVPPAPSFAGYNPYFDVPPA